MNERRWLILGWAAVAAALTPLFCLRGFGIDWFNHVWLVGHYGATLRETGHFPSMLSAGAIETGWPSFYGFLFYPLLSMPAAFIGPDLTVRIAAVLSIVAAFEVWRRLGRHLLGAGWPGILCGLAVALHPYQLTNLYNRSALTEFFGLAWFALVVGAAVRWLAQSAWPRPASPAVIAGLFLGVALVIGTHPITIYLGAIVVAPVLLAFAVGRRWRPTWSQLAWAAGGLALVALIGTRWVIDSRTWMTRINVSSSDIDYTAKFDGVLQRFSPVPIDPRGWQEDLNHWKLFTPFLEAPLNWAIAVGALWLWWRRRTANTTDAGGSRRLTIALGVSCFVLVIGVLVSLKPHLYTYNATIDRAMQAVFHPMQFTYRIVGALQLVLVLMWMLAATGRRADERPAGAARTWLGAALVVALLGIAVKTIVLGATWRTMQRGVTDWVINDYGNVMAQTDRYPGCFYGLRGYALMGEHGSWLREAKSFDAELDFKRDPHRPWRTLDVSVEKLSGKAAKTDVVAAPFVSIVVDGRVLPNSELGDPEHYFAFWVPEGAHTVYATVDPRRHLWLNLLPWFWLAAAAGVSALAGREWRTARATLAGA